MFKLAPSILAADLSRLGEEVAAVEKAGAHLLHIDVMDGHFVPNISFGPGVMKSVCSWSDLPFDVHLMIENPEKHIRSFITDKTEYVTVHQEACVHLHGTIGLIKSFGVKAGVALNPGTPLSALDCVLSDLDMVLLMSVNPGFYGQEFIPSSMDKIRSLNETKTRCKLSFEIEVDGGVNEKNIREVAAAGAGIIVAGYSVFAGGKINQNVKSLISPYSYAE